MARPALAGPALAHKLLFLCRYFYSAMPGLFCRLKHMQIQLADYTPAGQSILGPLLAENAPGLRSMVACAAAHLSSNDFEPIILPGQLAAMTLLRTEGMWGVGGMWDDEDFAGSIESKLLHLTRLTSLELATMQTEPRDLTIPNLSSLRAFTANCGVYSGFLKHSPLTHLQLHHLYGWCTWSPTASNMLVSVTLCEAEEDTIKQLLATSLHLERLAITQLQCGGVALVVSVLAPLKSLMNNHSHRDFALLMLSRAPRPAVHLPEGCRHAWITPDSFDFMRP